jgi:hypothetical protein
MISKVGRVQRVWWQQYTALEQPSWSENLNECAPQSIIILDHQKKIACKDAKSEKYKYITGQIQLYNQIMQVHHTICGWIWIWLIRYRQRTTTVNRILQSAETMFARGELSLKNILDWIQLTEPLPWAKSPFPREPYLHTSQDAIQISSSLISSNTLIQTTYFIATVKDILYKRNSQSYAL